jgi:hypothetical protein
LRQGGVAATPRQRGAGHECRAKESIDPDEPFVTDGRDFDHRAVLHHRGDRGDAAIGEEDLANRFVSWMKDLLDREWDGPKMWAKTGEVGPRQGGQ